MNTSLEKIISLIERYPKHNLDVKFRVQTKADCDEKYQNYIGGSGWKNWLGNPTETYIDFGYEPTPHRMIKQIQINPIEERNMGRLIPSKVLNHTKEVCELLDEIKIKYEMQNVLICIT